MTETPKRTPGPWEIADDPLEWKNHITSQNGTIAYVVFQPEAEANARLIAAAPELLEALEEECSERCWQCRGDNLPAICSRACRIKKHLQLIAKAKGEDYQ